MPTSLSNLIVTCFISIAEVSKLQQHLNLLRDQYSLLQEKCEKLQLEKDAIATSSDGGESFTSRLVAFVAQLHNKVRVLVYTY